MLSQRFSITIYYTISVRLTQSKIEVVTKQENGWLELGFLVRPTDLMVVISYLSLGETEAEC